MITEYTDCAELMRLITDQKIKPAAIKRYLGKQGIIFTATNAQTLANDMYTIFLGGQEMTSITQMIVSDGNYEKSTLVNAKLREHSDSTDILDFFADKFNAYRSSNFRGYVIEQPIKSGSELIVNMSYKRKLPGKNKLIQDETRYIHIAIRKKGESEASIDIRQPSSYDAQKALELLQAMTDSSEESEVSLAHVNLELLTDKNKVGFYDRLSAYSFSNWRLKTVVGITVKKATSPEDDIEEEDSENDESSTGTLAGISQAVLNGSGLRSNEFVQSSIQQRYYISSMKYRYVCTQEAGEFVVAINSRGENLRVDIEKSFSDDDGTLYVQPFSKELQDEIIRAFQEAANIIFYSLIEDQKSFSAKSTNLPR